MLSSNEHGNGAGCCGRFDIVEVIIAGVPSPRFRIETFVRFVVSAHHSVHKTLRFE